VPPLRIELSAETNDTALRVDQAARELTEYRGEEPAETPPSPIAKPDKAKPLSARSAARELASHREQEADIAKMYDSIMGDVDIADIRSTRSPHRHLRNKTTPRP
jgi:hypothetical protein